MPKELELAESWLTEEEADGLDTQGVIELQSFKTQQATLKAVRKWLEAHAVDWFDDGKGNKTWVQTVYFEASDWEDLKKLAE